ncbi:hypothetical protein [Burkholderia vietnamiensis]|uniref:hypothetical protein n=1 Tax=Burkholderia vietnamiensis TaxID=60552 RepID=UPI001CF5FAB9|nr:hypothetical protein [Burkholderia vietnamiensis]MCA8266448.1 hypothetical protein [Burkholderia vietnamiensis]
MNLLKVAIQWEPPAEVAQRISDEAVAAFAHLPNTDETARHIASELPSIIAKHWRPHLWAVGDVRFALEDPPVEFPEHAPRSAAMDWCARELARSRRPPSPDYGSAMWAGIRKSELVSDVLTAVEQKRAEERDTRLRAAERHLQPLGVFAVGAIMAAIREVAR